MFADYYQVRDWLEKYIPNVYGKEELGLARIEYLLKLLGNPEKKFKSIHVAGTAGKGSAAFYIAQMLQSNRGTISRRARGRTSIKVGLHTSPHLVYIGERMQINGVAISPIRLIRLISQIRPIVEQIEKQKPDLAPSYFEILVAASFLYFAQEKVDIAVVEVGLGGRLDATNVILPEVSVITNIGLDHTEILGNTVEKIAYEKAGIIKEGVSVVAGASGKALQVIADVAKKRQAPLIKVNTQKAPKELADEPFWQSKLLAMETVKQLSGTRTVLVQGQSLLDSMPGRLEWINEGVLIDGAHNVDKIKFLIENFRGTSSPKPARGRTSKINLVLAFKKGKNWKKMVDLLVDNLPVGQIIATKYQAATDTGFGSSVDPKEIKKYIETSYQRQVKAFDNSQEAVWEAMDSYSPISHLANSKSVVIVTGSLYLVGEVRTMWRLPTF